MILMKTVLVLSMIGIQLAASVEEVAHHQDAEDIEYLKQLVKDLTLGQNIILQGLIQSVEKQSSKIKGAKADVIQRIKYEVLQEAIEKEESLRELGFDDVDIEGIQWVTAKLTGATTEEDAIAKVLKGMSNQDLKALKKNIDGKIVHGVLEEMDDDELNTFMESIHENDLVDNKASQLLIDQEKVLNVLEDMDEDELEAFIENMNENEVGDRNRNKVLGILEDTDEEDTDGMINKIYDESDIEQVIDNMSDTELNVVLKNVEDQQLGELVTTMNDQDFNEVMRNLKGDTEEISMARDIVKMIQSEELDDLTHQKLEQHGKELSQSRKRRDLNDVLGENIGKNRRKRETEEGFQGFSSSDVLTTIAGHQQLMANIVEKEKESRERKRIAEDILEKQKDQRAEEMFKEPTYLAPNFNSEGEFEERKKSAGYLGLLSLYEHSRKKGHAINKGEKLDEDSDGIESLATGDRQKRGLPGLEWLFAPDTTFHSLIGHQAEPDTNREPYFNQDFLNPFSLLRSEPDTNSEPYLDRDYVNPFTKFYSEPHSYSDQTQWTYSEPEPEFKPSYHEPEVEPEVEPEPESEPESTYEHQPTPSAEPLPEPICTESDPTCSEPQTSNHQPDYVYEYEPQITCDGSDPTCLEPQPTCDGSDPTCNKPQSNFLPETTNDEPQTTCDGSDPTCLEPQPICDGSDPTCNKPQSNFLPETTEDEPQTTCDGSDPTCLEPQPICDGSDPTCNKPQSNFPPETTDEEPQTTCDGSDPTCLEPQPICDWSDPTCNKPQSNFPPETNNEEPQTTCDGSDPTCLELQPICDWSDPTCHESQPNSPPEDAHGDHDDHYHHHTTISLGSDVYKLVSPISTATTADTSYRTSAETSTLTNNNAPYEKLTLSNGVPKKTTIYFRGHSTPLKNSHMDTLKSVKFPHELEGLSLQNEKYSVIQTGRENNAPNEKLTLSYGAPNKPTIHGRQHSKPLNSHMDTLKSVKMPHDAAPTVTPFSWSTFKERRESVRPQISHKMKSAELDKNVPNVLKRSNF